MNKGSILIIGSGHLEYRVRKQIETDGYTVFNILRDKFESKDNVNFRFEYITNLLIQSDLSSMKMVYVLDDNDDFNLEIIIALISLNNKLPITASLFNENIAPHLQASHSNITILNPAKIAGPRFVQALYTPIKRTLRYELPKRTENKLKIKSDDLILKLTLGFGTIICLSTVYFHLAENLTWINSLYFIIVTIATVGYGDINLLNSSFLSKSVDIALIICSTLFIWIIFSLTVDRIIKKRVQLSLGRKKYGYSDHVILCGLGKLGYFIAEELLSRGEKIIIVEKNEDSSIAEYFKKYDVDIYIGDARLPKVLQDVGVMRAKALISVINNDYINLEVGLNARSFDPKLRLILRIFDESMSQKIKDHLDINLTLSTSAIADENFLAVLKNA